MHISLMQRIDYWVGIPLCALCSTLNWGRKRFRRSVKSPPRKIAFVELSEMGSAILAHSAMEYARTRYNAELYFVVFARNRESIELLNVVPQENILVVEDRSFLTFALSMVKTLLKIRRLGIDTCIDLELFSRCTALISFLSGATNTVGFDRHTNEGLYRGNFLTHPVAYNSHQHISLNFLSLVFGLETPEAERPLCKVDLSAYLKELPRFNPAPVEIAKVESLLEHTPIDDGPLVIINPDPGLLPLRGWPADYFADLAQEIITHIPSAKVAVIGVERARSYALAIVKQIGPESCIDLTGRTATVREAVAVLAQGDLLVSIDSGPAHFAALNRIPSIVLFGPETPSLYAPLGNDVTTLTAGLACSPCYSAANHRKSTCMDNRCMKALTVERVASVALAKLKGQKRSSSLHIIETGLDAH